VRLCIHSAGAADGPASYSAIVSRLAEADQGHVKTPPSIIQAKNEGRLRRLR
jgi:hypothetical protein